MNNFHIFCNTDKELPLHFKNTGIHFHMTLTIELRDLETPNQAKSSKIDLQGGVRGFGHLSILLILVTFCQKCTKIMKNKRFRRKSGNFPKFLALLSLVPMALIARKKYSTMVLCKRQIYQDLISSRQTGSETEKSSIYSHNAPSSYII